MDKVFVERLVVRGKHGVHERERQAEQEFHIDIEAQVDTKAAAESDNITDTADYTKFCEIAREAVERNSFYLIEKLADTIARKILEDARIKQVEVTVRKPEALESGIAGVTVVRSRS